MSAGQGVPGTVQDVQVGEIDITEVKDKSSCTSTTGTQCPIVDKNRTCNKVPESKLTFWYNGASSLDSLHSHDNLRIADDLPSDKLESGPNGFAQMCAAFFYS